MRKYRWAILGLMLMAFVVGLAGCSYPTASAPPVVINPSNVQNTGLWVTGEGKVAATPDVAILNLGIEAQAKTVAEAQNQATDAMNKVMKVFTGNGVQERDIQTQRFSIQPVTRWNKDLNREELVGYRVSNMVIVKIRDLNKIGVIIDAVAVAGGDLTRIQSIGFTIDDPTLFYKQARDKALADASARAKQIAMGLDVKVGRPTYISEGSLYVPPPRLATFEKAVAGAPVPAPSAPPISAGELEVKLSVQVVYEIR